MEATRRFLPRPESASLARRFVLSALGGWGQEATDVVALLTSEVVTNVVMHAGPHLPGELLLVGVTRELPLAFGWRSLTVIRESRSSDTAAPTSSRVEVYCFLTPWRRPGVSCRTMPARWCGSRSRDDGLAVFSSKPSTRRSRGDDVEVQAIPARWPCVQSLLRAVSRPSGGRIPTRRTFIWRGLFLQRVDAVPAGVSWGTDRWLKKCRPRRR